MAGSPKAGQLWRLRHSCRGNESRGLLQVGTPAHRRLRSVTAFSEVLFKSALATDGSFGWLWLELEPGGSSTFLPARRDRAKEK